MGIPNMANSKEQVNQNILEDQGVLVLFFLTLST